NYGTEMHKTGNAIRALGRMANLSAMTRRGSQSPQMTTRSSSQDSSKSGSRGRQCSERSDSGFSDCSTTGSLSNPSSGLLSDKKYSISEEAEQSQHSLHKFHDVKPDVEDQPTKSIEEIKPVKSAAKVGKVARPTNENFQKTFAFWNR
ncbi:hypothetical protein GE061_005842, partial [Apolygus lucorum]